MFRSDCYQISSCRPVSRALISGVWPMNFCSFGWSSLRITAPTAGFVNRSVKMPHSFSTKSIDLT